MEYKWNTFVLYLSIGYFFSMVFYMIICVQVSRLSIFGVNQMAWNAYDYLRGYKDYKVTPHTLIVKWAATASYWKKFLKALYTILDHQNSVTHAL